MLYLGEMPGFSALLTVGEAKARFARVYTPRPRGTEHVALDEAFGRVLAADVLAPEDLPPFDRSTVDGYAVRAEDTRGATPEAPAEVRLVGEVLMGEPASCRVGPGEAARIATGGMLPEGADAVVMLEDADVRGGAVAVRRPVRPGDNVIRRAEDISRGEVAVRQGTRLRPQEVGLLAALGAVRVEVFLRPRVAVVATGDEVVPPDRVPGPGQVRDVNTYALGALVRQAGGVPRSLGIVEDSPERLLQVLAEARAAADLVLVSGGSSVGSRDAVAHAVNALGKPGVVVHGVSIKPGKPTILAVAEGTPIVGLPGHPVSGMVIFDVFVRDLLRGLSGERPRRGFGQTVRARLDRAVASAGVREDHIRVALEERAGTLWAIPIVGKSGVITTMTRADGVVVVPQGQDRVEEGAEVEVRLFDA